MIQRGRVKSFSSLTRPHSLSYAETIVLHQTEKKGGGGGGGGEPSERKLKLINIVRGR